MWNLKKVLSRAVTLSYHFPFIAMLSSVLPLLKVEVPDLHKP